MISTTTGLAIVASIASATAQSAPVSSTTSPVGAWKVEGDRATVVPARIALPVRADALTLVNTTEASLRGQGVDDVAQYESADRAVQATAYIFLATYADTALATIATDRAIRQRYGTALKLSDERLVTVDGTVQAGIRRIYTNGQIRAGEPLTTAAAFVRAGAWLVVLRVSAPAARGAEAERAIDALLAGLTFPGDNKPLMAQAPRIVGPCQPATDVPAKPIGKSKNDSATALGAMILAASVNAKDKAGKPLPLAFPANGATAICVRGTVRVNGAAFDLLQPVGAPDSVTLLQVDDAGGMIAIEPVLLGKGYQLKRYRIGSMQLFGTYDAIPTTAQFAALLDGSDRTAGRVRASTTLKPDGDTAINIDPATLK